MLIKFIQFEIQQEIHLIRIPGKSYFRDTLIFDVEYKDARDVLLSASDSHIFGDLLRRVQSVEYWKGERRGPCDWKDDWE